MNIYLKKFLSKRNLLRHLNKHFIQIKKGGMLTIIKKLRSLIYLILQIPIYLISIPIVIVVFLIKPWFFIRWQRLISGRIGHFAVETELYCCERDAGINSPSQKYIDVFYLQQYVCNEQLEKMWRRNLIILPKWLMLPFAKVNYFFCFFIPSFKEHEINYPAYGARDVRNLMDKFTLHISFTSEEELKGKEILKKFGVPEDAKFICLNVRDSGYINKNKKFKLRDWSYHDYRNGDIDKFVLAAEELARRGYYVFRMGINVLKPLKSPNPKVIDYANSKMRSSFMDIYLGAKCCFCISTSAGFDGIPCIFRKPIAYITVPFGTILTSNEKTLSITNHHKQKKNNKKLTISEIFSTNVAFSDRSDEFKQNNVELEDNSPEEIRDLAIEMDERLNGNWKETREDLLLQKKFLLLFEKNIKKMNLKKTLHGTIKSRFGAMFLRKNQDWIR